jgi:hypothetical protein
LSAVRISSAFHGVSCFSDAKAAAVSAGGSQRSWNKRRPFLDGEADELRRRLRSARAQHSLHVRGRHRPRRAKRVEVAGLRSDDDERTAAP